MTFWKYDDFLRESGETKHREHDISLLKNFDFIDLPLAEYITGLDDLEDRVYAQSKTVYDIVGGIGVYLTVYRPDLASHFIFAGACEKDEHVNLSHEFRRKIYICSPFSAETDERKDFHIWIARNIAKCVMRRGDIPVAPHLYYPQLLDDGKLEDRELALELGKLLLEECDIMMICKLNGRTSSGMVQEIVYASNYLDIDIREENFNIGILQREYYESLKGRPESGS